MRRIQAGLLAALLLGALPMSLTQTAVATGASAGADLCATPDYAALCPPQVPGYARCKAVAVVARTDLLDHDLVAVSAVSVQPAVSAAQVGIPLAPTLTADVAEASCDATSWTKACGEARLSEVRIQLAGQIIQADLLQERGCSHTLAGPTGGATVTNLRIGSNIVPVSGTPNELHIIPLVGFLVLNEVHEGLSPCRHREGNALRVYSQVLHTEVIIGWVATAACRITPGMDSLANPVGGSASSFVLATDRVNLHPVGPRPVPTGLVHFTICAPNVPSGPNCSSGGTPVPPAGTGKPLDASGSGVSDGYFAWYPFSPAGRYCWRTAYEGDDLYFARTHFDGLTECFTLRIAPKVVTTSQPSGHQEICCPAVLQDQVTLSGPLGVPTGSVSFYLCGPAASPAGCPSGGASVGLVGIPGSGQLLSPKRTVNSSGWYCWRAEYHGNAVYLPVAHTNSDTECVSVDLPVPK